MKGGKKIKDKKILKKLIAIFILAAMVISTTSCKKKVDVQNLAIILAMGVDLTDEGKYKVSYQMLNTNPSQGGGLMDGGDSGGLGVIHFEGTGETVSEAMFAMRNKISKKLHFGQLRLLVIGERAAGLGIAPIVDTMVRFSEIKTNLPIYATKGEASAIVRQNSQEDPIPANTIDNIITIQVTEGGHPVVYLAQLADRLASKFSISVLGVINSSKTAREASGSDFTMEGIAIFNNDRLVGYLDDKKSLGYQYIRGKVKLVTSSLMISNGHKVALTLLDCNSKIKTAIVDGEPQIVINIKQRGYLREVSGSIDFVKNPEALDEIAKLQEDVVRKTVEETINAAKKDLKIDFIGIGEAIYRQHPKDFEKLKNTWKNKFLSLNIKVNVNVDLKDTGLLSKTVE